MMYLGVTCYLYGSGIQRLLGQVIGYCSRVGQLFYLFFFCTLTKKVPRTSILHACAMSILDSVCIVIIVLTIQI